MIYSRTGTYRGEGGSGMYRYVAWLTKQEREAVRAGEIVVIDRDCPTGNRELPVRYVERFGEKFAPRSFTDRKLAEEALILAGYDQQEWQKELGKIDNSKK